MIPYNDNWAVQDMIEGKVSTKQVRTTSIA